MVYGDLAEAEPFVEFAGTDVTRGDLQRNPVGAFFLCPLLASLEEGAADAETPVVGEDIDVFDGGPGFWFKGGGAFAQLAGKEADHLPVPLGDEEAGVGVGGEIGEEAAHSLFGVGSGGVDVIVECVFLGASYPESGGLGGIVSLPGTDGEASFVRYFVLFATFSHAPIVAYTLLLVAELDARGTVGENCPAIFRKAGPWAGSDPLSTDASRVNDGSYPQVP